MKKLRFLLFIAFAFSALDSIAQTWVPSENSHFGIDGFETADAHRLSSDELNAAYAWEAASLINMNIGWNRTLSPAGGQFKWDDVQRVRENYDWTIPDAFVKKVQAENIRLLVLIHPFAQWDQPTKTSMNYDKPNDMTAFKRFIAKLVERYDGDGVEDMQGLLYPIKYYEIGNEPELGTFGDSPGTFNDFMNTVKAARDTARVVYPDVKIVIGGTSPVYDGVVGFNTDVDAFWKGALNRTNVGNYFDVFNFHFWVGEYTQDVSVYIDYWTQLLSTYGLSGKEIWITETGTYSGTPSGYDNQPYSFQSTSYQAGWWLKQASYALANGVSKLFWVFYYSDQTDWKSAVAYLNIDKTTKKAVYYAHKLMADKIDAYSSVLQNAYAESGQYQTSGNFKFTVNNKPVYVVWNDAGGNAILNGFSSAQVKVTKAVPNVDGNGTVVLDGLGNPTFESSNVTVTNGQATVTLTSVPVYVEEISAPPSAPTLISPTNNATAITTTTTLSWNSSNGAASYRLQVSTNSNFSTNFFDQSNITTTSQQVTGLGYSTLYYWRVNASNNDGTSDWSSVWSFTTQGTAPGIPTLLSPSDGAINLPTTLTLSWNASSGADSYRLQVSTNSNFSTTIFDQGNITTTSQQVAGFSNSILYYWHVNASNVNGTSSYSSTWSFTTINATLVEETGSDKPSAFFLFQNYPNPFNPETTIKFSVPVETRHASFLQHVLLKVYDLMGREIATLVNEKLMPGKYTETFNGTNLPSGIYFYVLRTGTLTSVKKMVLLK